MNSSFSYKEVNINGVTYQFSNRIGRDSMLLKSFNRLSLDTFRISFETVGGDYEPHVLIRDGRVCANVSVNQIHFLHWGEEKFYIQLGTVMTAPEFRGNGLSRWLIQWILDEWKGRCDSIYLFANDRVLDFYPRFGFEKQEEWEYWRTGISQVRAGLRKLDMEEDGDIRLAEQKYEQGNPFSAFCMRKNRSIFDFYIKGIMKEQVYYSVKHDMILIMEKEEGKTLCYDLFGKTEASMNEVLGTLTGDVKDEVILGFTPMYTDEFLCRKHEEEDITLFVLDGGDCPFIKERMMLPIISHA